MFNLIRLSHQLRRRISLPRHLSTSSSNPSSPLPNASTTTNPTNPLDALSGDSVSSATTLLEHLQLLISFRGPITVAEYINHALLHPEYGYYTQNQEEGGAVFGKDHDFTTAPEISQMFAELLGVWVVHTAMTLGFEKFHLVEIGPGRGTLMEDVVRTISQFKDVSNNMEAIHLVERSASLRKLQQDKIKWKNVQWHDTFSEVPGDVPCIVLAQELFDALPVHQFELTEHGWCERLVDILQPEEENEENKMMEGEIIHSASDDEPSTIEPSTIETIETEDPTMVSVKLPKVKTTAPPLTLVTNDGNVEPEQLRFVLSPAPTNASRVYVRMFDPFVTAPLAEAPNATIENDTNESTSTDTENMKVATTSTTNTDTDTDTTTTTTDTSNDSSTSINKEDIGSRLEVSPAGCALAQDIALRISAYGGAALIVDYGKDRASGDSLRGIKNHQFVSPLENPGRVDLSVDVDFASLKAAALALKIEGLNVYGTVGQGEFLKKMGIETRLHALLTKTKDITEQEQEDMYLAYHRLTDEEEMGTVYRAMSMVSMPPEIESDYVAAPPAGFTMGDGKYMGGL